MFYIKFIDSQGFRTKCKVRSNCCGDSRGLHSLDQGEESPSLRDGWRHGEAGDNFRGDSKGGEQVVWGARSGGDAS